MNWAWASSLDHLWRSPSFPMWLTLAAAGFFAIILLVTLLRAERSVANGALTVITLLAIGVACGGDHSRLRPRRHRCFRREAIAGDERGTAGARLHR